VSNNNGRRTDDFTDSVYGLTAFRGTVTVRYIVGEGEGFKKFIQTYIPLAFLTYRQDSVRYRKDGHET
jgi:hypothetical protein